MVLHCSTRFASQCSSLRDVPSPHPLSGACTFLPPGASKEAMYAYANDRRYENSSQYVWRRGIREVCMGYSGKGTELTAAACMLILATVSRLGAHPLVSPLSRLPTVTGRSCSSMPFWLTYCTSAISPVPQNRLPTPTWAAASPHACFADDNVAAPVKPDHRRLAVGDIFRRPKSQMGVEGEIKHLGASAGIGDESGWMRDAVNSKYPMA